MAVTPNGQAAFDADFQRPRFVLQERLGGQHVLDFAGADAEGQGAERPVGGRVAVAANDRHARLRQPQFRSDDVDDALIAVVEVVEANTEVLAVLPQGIDLLLGDLVGDRQRAAGGRHVVVDRGHGPLGPPHLPSGEPQRFEGLGAGHLVDELQVDIQDRLLALFAMHDMAVPYLLEHCSGGGSHIGAEILDRQKEKKSALKRTIR